VSASGKTTLQEELLKRDWNRPYNFTTRKPRSEEELDEYVFITKEQFFEKMEKGDFLENTNY
jgi:guanylate kinase